MTSIKDHVLKWVTTLEPLDAQGEIAVNGVILGEDFGLGKDLARSFNGTIRMIAGVTGEEWSSEGSINLRHSTTRGFDWVIRAPALSSLALVVPFLLTDSLTLRRGFHGNVSIALTPFGQEALPEVWEGVIPVEVAGQNMVGVLDHCVLVSSTELIGEATLFTDASEVDPCGALLSIAQMDAEAFGTIMKKIG